MNKSESCILSLYLKFLAKNEFQFRWLNLKRIDAAIHILITLIFNHLIWISSKIILGRKINFSPLYIVFSKLTLNESQTFFENHLTFTLRQQIKALHNFKNSQSLLSGVTHPTMNRKLVGSKNRFFWVRFKVNGRAEIELQPLWVVHFGLRPPNLTQYRPLQNWSIFSTKIRIYFFCYLIFYFYLFLGIISRQHMDTIWLWKAIMNDLDKRMI